MSAEDAVRIDAICLKTFVDRVGREFWIATADGEKVLVTLRSCTELPRPMRADGSPLNPRESFSLLFQGPSDPLLPQGVYRFQIPDLGLLDVFIVPTGRNSEGYEYEAVFN